ncbi:hypothetical protein BASA81_012378 [Batrachochytrium salamandrivorans]|nr:hypothetical protein BASA81_012378 [Batrachochytrium salamandrivorans]
MVIALEAQYAKTVVSNRIQANADHESTDEESHGKASSSVETVMSRLSQQCFAISLWSSVVFGRRKLATFSLREINIAKSSYALFTLFYVSPGAIIILVVLVAIPPLSLCNAQCHDMFLEMEIGILAVMGYFIIFCLKIVHIMYELVGFDDKGLMMEMSFIVIGGGVVILTKTGLAIGDPNDWDFDRVMNWQCLVFLIAGVNITITGWYQIGVAYSQTLRDRREDAGQEQANVIKMMIPLLENNPTLRKEFTEFGVKQYVVESIQFLEDVAQFKNLFYQKGDTWRAQKVNMLIKNYVKVGTDMEINISSAARDRILQRVKITKIDQASFDIFDEAYDQIKEMVQNGAWREFTRNRVMPSSPTIASSSSPISGLLASPSRKM